MKNIWILFVLPLLFAACSGQQKNAATQMDNKEVVPISQAKNVNQNKDLKEAIFAGGCFWCTEAVFERVKGVEDVISGYTDGFDKTPTYREVANGETGHTEAIIIYYNPEVVTYEQLVEYFYASHDPTQLNRQGPDVGTQYRSGIYYLNDEQKVIAENFTKKLNASGKFDKPIVTEIKKATEFYQAEDYHQNYYEDFSNPNQGYVQGVTRPKVEKFMKEYPHVLKEKYKKS